MNETVTGSVTASLGDSRYKIAIGDKEVVAYLAGKMKKNKIRVLVGDTVEIVLDPHGGHATNRIVRRRL